MNQGNLNAIEFGLDIFGDIRNYCSVVNFLYAYDNSVCDISSRLIF